MNKDKLKWKKVGIKKAVSMAGSAVSAGVDLRFRIKDEISGSYRMQYFPSKSKWALWESGEHSWISTEEVIEKLEEADDINFPSSIYASTGSAAVPAPAVSPASPVMSPDVLEQRALSSGMEEPGVSSSVAGEAGEEVGEETEED